MFLFAFCEKRNADETDEQQMNQEGCSLITVISMIGPRHCCQTAMACQIYKSNLLLDTDCQHPTLKIHWMAMQQNKSCKSSHEVEIY